jgi:hypothetical protein
MSRALKQGAIVGGVVLFGLSAGINALQARRIRSLTTATAVSALVGRVAQPIEGFGLDPHLIVRVPSWP